MTMVSLSPGRRTALAWALLIGAGLALSSCSQGKSAGPAAGHATVSSSGGTRSRDPAVPAPVVSGGSLPSAAGAGPPLPAPAAAAPFGAPAIAGEGTWHPA